MSVLLKAETDLTKPKDVLRDLDITEPLDRLLFCALVFAYCEGSFSEPQEGLELLKAAIEWAYEHIKELEE